MDQAERVQGELLRCAQLIMGSDQHEVRILPLGTSTLVKTPQEALQSLLGVSQDQGAYITMNPVTKVPASDSDIPRMKWLGVDVDARKNQRNVADGIKLYLQLHGFPEPVVAFSGRGVWLLYHCDMPNDEYHRRLRQRFLQHLHDQDGGAEVDVSVYNASRVMRFFGTMNPKGVRSRLWSVPDDIRTVTVGTLEELLGPDRLADPKSRAHVANELPLTGQTTGYGSMALRGELDALGTTPVGGRNTKLTAVCRRLRELVDSQQLDYEYALASIWATAEEIGLTDGEELSHTRATIRHNYEDYRTDVRMGDGPGGREPSQDSLSKTTGPMVMGGEGAVWDDWDETIPDIDWLIHERLGRGTLVWAYGAKEVGKSLYFLGLAKALTDKGEVVCFYSEEMPRSLDVRRITRLGIQKGHFRWRNGRGLNLADKQQLAQVIEENRGTSLIILDSYERVWNTSTMDENRRAVEFAKAMHKVIEATGATVVVIDHTGFGYRDEHGTLHEERKPRGASTKEQQADMSILISSKGKWDGGGTFRLTVENMKPGRLENPFKDDVEIRDTITGGLVIVTVGHRKENHEQR